MVETIAVVVVLRHAICLVLVQEGCAVVSFEQPETRPTQAENPGADVLPIHPACDALPRRRRASTTRRSQPRAPKWKQLTIPAGDGLPAACPTRLHQIVDEHIPPKMRLKSASCAVKSAPRR